MKIPRNARNAKNVLRSGAQRGVGPFHQGFQRPARRPRYYAVCPRCGAHLDPGETCDCVRREESTGQAHNGEEE